MIVGLFEALLPTDFCWHRSTRRNRRSPKSHWTRAQSQSALLSRQNNLIVDDRESAAQDDPLDHILVPFPQRLPHCLLFLRDARDGDSGSPARLG